MHGLDTGIVSLMSALDLGSLFFFILYYIDHIPKTQFGRFCRFQTKCMSEWSLCDYMDLKDYWDEEEWIDITQEELVHNYPAIEGLIKNTYSKEAWSKQIAQSLYNLDTTTLEERNLKNFEERLKELEERVRIFLKISENQHPERDIFRKELEDEASDCITELGVLQNKGNVEIPNHKQEIIPRIDSILLGKNTLEEEQISDIQAITQIIENAIKTLPPEESELKYTLRSISTDYLVKTLKIYFDVKDADPAVALALLKEQLSLMREATEKRKNLIDAGKLHELRVNGRFLKSRLLYD